MPGYMDTDPAIASYNKYRVKDTTKKRRFPKPDELTCLVCGGTFPNDDKWFPKKNHQGYPIRICKGDIRHVHVDNLDRYKQGGMYDARARKRR